MDCDGGGGTLRGSAMWVMAWHMAHRMDLAPCGSCNGVRQFEQSTSINMGSEREGYLGNR